MQDAHTRQPDFPKRSDRWYHHHSCSPLCPDTAAETPFRSNSEQDTGEYRVLWGKRSVFNVNQWTCLSVYPMVLVKHHRKYRACPAPSGYPGSHRRQRSQPSFVDAIRRAFGQNIDGVLLGLHRASRPPFHRPHYASSKSCCHLLGGEQGTSQLPNLLGHHQPFFWQAGKAYKLFIPTSHRRKSSK